MNMKDAFRFQNKLQTLMGTAQDILSSSRNITKVENTYLRKKVMPEAEDEVTVDQPTSEYSEQITCVAEFLLYLMTEKEKLGAAIYQAKATLDLQAGLDGEIGLNSTRQELAGLFRRMTEVRNSETLIPNGGTGFRFNNEGNQVSYRCDVKKVVTINFDRNKVRKMCADLSKKSDEISGQIDGAVVNTQVAYEAPFDVNDTFSDVFEAFAVKQATA